MYVTIEGDQTGDEYSKIGRTDNKCQGYHLANCDRRSENVGSFKENFGIAEQDIDITYVYCKPEVEIWPSSSEKRALF